MVVHLIFALIGFGLGVIVIGILTGSKMDELEEDNFDLKSKIYTLNKKKDKER